MLAVESKFNKKIVVEPGEIKRILIIGSIGIGNLLLFSPALKQLRKHFTGAEIDFIVLKTGFKALYSDDPDVDNVIVLDVDKTNTAGKKIQFIRDLRKNKYDICITTFPANRLEYNALSFLSGAKYRIAHEYEIKKKKTLSFLQNYRIPVDKQLHDLEQNLNLLSPFNIKLKDNDKKIFLHIPDIDKSKAEKYIAEFNLNGKQLIGVHAGSSADRGMDLKRWPENNFADLIDRLCTNPDNKVLLFGGPEELQMREKIASLSKTDILIVKDVSLLTTAALIGECSLFISNDSGLMHVSVAMGTKTVALFGPSDPGRTSPYGDSHEVIRLGMDCSPCWSINNLGVGWVNCIHPENFCMKNISIDSIFEVINNNI